MLPTEADALGPAGQPEPITQVAPKSPDARVLDAGGAEPTVCARQLERSVPIGDGV